jgi:hypothetical protein
MGVFIYNSRTASSTPAVALSFANPLLGVAVRQPEGRIETNDNNTIIISSNWTPLILITF